MGIVRRGGVKACHGSEHFFSKVCLGVESSSRGGLEHFFSIFANTFQKGASLRIVRLNLSILICVRACCRVKYWSDRLHETGCGVVGSETGIRGPYHLVPAGFCALHG